MNVRSRWSLLCFVLLLSACESELRLEGVEQSAKQSVRRTDTFQALAQLDGSIVAVGNHGVVLVSSDYGETWSRNQLSGYPTLIDVAACPDGDFFALAFEAKLWRSADAGNSWQSVPMGSSETPQALACDGSNKLWLIGGFATIQSTADKGNSWNDQSLGEDLFLTNIQFVNEDIGYIAGEFGTLLKTDDSGRNWQSLSPLPDEFYPHTALFKRNGIGWIGGLSGQILTTRDGGNSWNLQQTPTATPIYSIASVNGRLFAVGGAGVFLVYESDQWRLFEHGKLLRFFLRDIEFTGNNALLIAGGGGTLLRISIDID